MLEESKTSLRDRIEEIEKEMLGRLRCGDSSKSGCNFLTLSILSIDQKAITPPCYNIRINNNRPPRHHRALWPPHKSPHYERPMRRPPSFIGVRPVIGDGP
ncbi:hypothetical protein AVEN_93692-1 [Araneus ventricosus]|uniref:Uncharacterized protein n=1 Tax=Araneus ventricosus TaxID=182803 RepID=A0A4Y2NM85_ARAVE|nr:hypothetical protein AVEN_93692-1 [Araneus ventricosus]